MKKSKKFLKPTRLSVHGLINRLKRIASEIDEDYE